MENKGLNRLAAYQKIFKKADTTGFGIKKAVNIILSAKSIVIACHVNPDGDCIGSLLGLAFGLKSLGKKVFMLSQDGVPKKYRMLPGANCIRKRLDEKVDLAIAVDCNEKQMLGKSFKVFERAEKILEIDHHEFRVPFGDIAFVDTRAGAVGEMVFSLLRELNVSLTQNMAKNILTSIIVETDSFSLPNVRAFTFEVCAKLFDTGIDFPKFIEMIYWTSTKEKIILAGICLSRCKFLRKGKLVWSIIKQSDFKKFNGKDEDVDAVADQMRQIKDVLVSVFFRQKPHGLLRVSLRSKGLINVASLAQKFGGGGHFDVAGCTVVDSAFMRRKILLEAERLLNHLA